MIQLVEFLKSEIFSFNFIVLSTHTDTTGMLTNMHYVIHILTATSDLHPQLPFTVISFPTHQSDPD